MSSPPTDGLLRQLVMVRPTLDALPTLAPPESVGVRSFEPGDDAAWVAIINDSFGHDWGPEGFGQRMRDTAFRPARVWFATLDGEPVATASAWVTPRWGESVGVLHMVGCLSHCQGRGLGRLVSLAALHQMRREGRQRATLTTDDFRLAAIRSYLRLGFEPLLASEDHRQRWQRLTPPLVPLPPHWEPLLTGPLTALPPLA